MVEFAPNVLDKTCPSRQTLNLIANKWTVMIVHVLRDDVKRYGELQREVGGITKKMLTQTLRNLERDGLVERTVYAQVPPKVEYRLTPLGDSLRDVFAALCQWAEQHIEEVESARRQQTD